MKSNRHGKAAILTDEQFNALLEAAPSPRHATLWLLQRKTAARISEALALRWCDVEDAITFRKETTKTKTTRQLPLDDTLRTALAALHHPGADRFDYIFHARDSTSQPMSRRAADKALRQTCQKLGFKGVSTHSFRRTTATNLANNFALHEVASFTGHTSLSALQHYLQADPSKLSEMMQCN
jgi:integrase/recombinase XerD